MHCLALDRHHDPILDLPFVDVRPRAFPPWLSLAAGSAACGGLFWSEGLYPTKIDGICQELPHKPVDLSGGNE